MVTLALAEKLGVAEDMRHDVQMSEQGHSAPLACKPLDWVLELTRDYSLVLVPL
jgi:hypothetical protein